MPSEACADLNPAQQQVAAHEHGPLLVVAGAGTGKTKALAARVARLLDQGMAPTQILLLTFSRRAAVEMLLRAGQMVGDARAEHVWGGTFHAVGHRLLRTYGPALGLAARFSVLDQADAADLMDLVRSDVAAQASTHRFPRKDTLLTIYSRVANTRRPLRDVLESTFPWCMEHCETIAQVFGAYAHRKRQQSMLDFDDLLLYWAHATTDPHVGSLLVRRFEHVLVDEYQDTNLVQAEIVHAMTQHATSVMVVGDDAQAIYGFRAATVRNILDFPQHYPATTIVALEENYRSTPEILAVANAVIREAAERHDKELWSRRPSSRRPELVTCLDEPTQADTVCETLLAHYEDGIRLQDQAVLFRAAHHSDLLELELARRGIPFVKYGGLRFLEAAHIKDLLALLRVVENPYDELAWFRTLRLAEGIGPRQATRLLERLGVRPRADAAAPVERLTDLAGVPHAAHADLRVLATALQACAVDPPIPPPVQVARLRVALERFVRRRYEHADARVRDLEELEHVATRHRSRTELVAELVLDPPSGTGELAGAPSVEEDYLVLSTVHSAKGGEWNVVHVLHAADGIFPSDMATGDPDQIEEERRLFYVALTRAQNHLHVYFPLRYFRRRHRGDAHHFAQLSRFLGGDVCSLFDRRDVGPPSDPEDSPVDVDRDGSLHERVESQLHALWQ